MSFRALRSYQRRKTNLELDLNRVPTPPAAETPREEVEGPSVVPLVPMIDVEAIDNDDDDVIESSPRAFAQAKTNARRNRRRTIVDVDLEDQTRATNDDHNRSTRDQPIQPIINCDLYISLEGSSSSMIGNARKSPEPPMEPVFNCPICMAPLTEEMSTKCGHIFCKKCIKAAITAHGKCPTCRKRLLRES